MMVLHPYTHVHEAVRTRLLELWPGAVLIDCFGDQYQPWKTMARVWGEDDLVVVEQHKLVTSQVAADFANCPSQWCVFPHELVHRGNWCYDGLGCVRFRRELQADVSAEDVEAYYGCCPACSADGVSSGRGFPVLPGCWRHLDGEIANLLCLRGYRRCVHQPGVQHWKVYHPGDRCG